MWLLKVSQQQQLDNCKKSVFFIFSPLYLAQGVNWQKSFATTAAAWKEKNIIVKRSLCPKDGKTKYFLAFAGTLHARWEFDLCRRGAFEVRIRPAVNSEEKVHHLPLRLLLLLQLLLMKLIICKRTWKGRSKASKDDMYFWWGKCVQFTAEGGSRRKGQLRQFKIDPLFSQEQ